MSVTIEISGKKSFTIQNSEEVDLDFSYNQFSPNPTFVSAFVAQFVCTPTENPIQFIRDEMSVNGVSQNLEALLNISNINSFNEGFNVAGQLNLSSPDNAFIFGQGQKSQFDIKFEPYPNTFFDRAERLSMIEFSSKNNNDWRQVSYVTERNSPLEDFMLLVVATQTLIEAARAVYNLFEVIKESISSGFDTVSATIKVVLKIAMNIVYTAAVLIALNELLKQASEILFDKPKKVYALDVWKTIEDGCIYLGYTFDSTLKDKYKDLIFVAASTEGGDAFSDPTNNPLPQYSFLQFIENIGAKYNAKLKVLENTVTFENVRYYEDTPEYQDVKLLDLYNAGSPSFNFEELPETITVKYLKVDGDNNYKTKFYSESYSLNNGNNKYFGAKNSLDINLAFAIGEAKTEESNAEKIFNGIFDLLTGLSKGYKTNVGSRLGFWKLEQNIIPADTIFIADSDGRISDKTYKILTPKRLFIDNYESENPKNNQFTIVKGRGKQPICGVNTNVLIANNVITDNNDNGRKIIITKNIRQSQDGLYDIEYRKRLESGDFGYVSPNLINTKTIEQNV